MPIVDTETHEAMTGALAFLREREHLIRTALDEYARGCRDLAAKFAAHADACESDPELAARTDRSFITVDGYRQLAETNHQAWCRTQEALAELEAWAEIHTW